MFTWIALGALVLTVVLGVRANRLRLAMNSGSRTRRRLNQQMITGIGVWQLCIAGARPMFDKNGTLI